MAAHAGSEGIVKIADNQIAEVKSWQIEEICDTVDSSIIGTEWRKSLATIKSWSGQIEVFWDKTDANGQGAFSVGSSVVLNLYPEGVGGDRHYFTGTVIVSNISRQGSFDGLIESSFSFQGNGALTKIKQQQQQQEGE